MLSTSHSRVSKMFSLASLLALVSLLLTGGAFPSHTPQTHVAGSSGIHTVAGKAAKVTIVDPLKLSKAHGASQASHFVPYRALHKRRASVGSGSIPHMAGALANNSGALLHNFNGVSVVDVANVNGFDVEPPDQGLCVGNGFVVEPVNLALTIYRPNGIGVAGPVSLPAFFGEAPVFTPPDTNIQGDVRCYFDSATNTFFATQLFLTTTLTNNVSWFDVAVNTSGDPTTPWTVYRFDTTDLANAGCPCLGDQPLFGIDQFNIYISTNEFSILGPNFNGAQVYAISKSQLEALTSSVNFVQFGNLGIGGTIAVSVEPAITDDRSAKAEFFLNTLDPFGTFDNRIGVWAMTNREAVSSGGIPTLSSVVITSEVYGFPPLATDPSGFPINTDDDRMLQVQYIHGQLWAANDTALIVPGDSLVRSGAAWYEIHPTLKGQLMGGATITDQGYVFSQGNYLLYPAVVAARDGNAAMVMTLMGPGTFASAVYATRPASRGHRDFNNIHVAASGVTADNGFTCLPPGQGNICRWGDYSAAVLDPAGSGIWLATEYIPGTGNANADWGTRVFEVQV